MRGREKFQRHSLARAIAFVITAMLFFSTVLTCVNRNVMIIGEITSAFFAPFFHLFPGLCRMLGKVIFSTTMFRHDLPLYYDQTDKHREHTSYTE